MKIKILLFALVWFLSSCDDFLHEQSKDLAYATSCKDLNEMLIGSGYMLPVSSGNVSSNSHYYTWLHVMDDDVEAQAQGSYSIGSAYKVMASFYSWDKTPSQNISGDPLDDQDWKKLYKYIAVTNVVIPMVDNFPGDPEESRRKVRGEAQFLRAAYYYLLVNMYAKPYVKASADTDAGVPLKLSEYVDGGYIGRDATGKVYAQIVKDLKDAIENLKGIVQPSVYRTNESAARVLLSRVYLYMGEWELANAECDSVLNKGVHLQDLNSLVSGSSFLDNTSPEVIFVQGSSVITYLMGNDNSQNYASFRVSDDLESKFEVGKDLRLDHFFTRSTKNKKLLGRKERVSPQTSTVSDVFMIRAAEVYLNKAEALAMMGRDAEAIETVQHLRKNRIKTGMLSDVTESGERLVNFIRDERRRELCLECHRWFDLRRYAVSPKYPMAIERIEHTVWEPGENGKSAVLKGKSVLKSYFNDNAWVMPIPGYEITYNKGAMIDNDEREERILE